MNGYFVWCGSVIKESDSAYHMFASRWPEETGFPEGYREHSEIVRAVSDNPLGPFLFKEVVIGERDSSFWDANMASNPVIYKIKDKYVLFYIGSDFTSRNNNHVLRRKIGFASSDHLNGPWQRSGSAIFDFDANNPSVCIEPDNSLKMVLRDADLRVFVAVADSFNGKYSIVNNNVWPSSKLEDFYFFRINDSYHIICEDNTGCVSGHQRWGVHIWSEDGISNWKKHESLIAYDHTIQFTNNREMHCVRRERPQLLIEDGKIKYLYTAVYDSIHTWNQPVEIFQ